MRLQTSPRMPNVCAMLFVMAPLCFAACGADRNEVEASSLSNANDGTQSQALPRTQDLWAGRYRVNTRLVTHQSDAFGCPRGVNKASAWVSKNLTGDYALEYTESNGARLLYACNIDPNIHEGSMLQCQGSLSMTVSDASGDYPAQVHSDLCMQKEDGRLHGTIKERTETTIGNGVSTLNCVYTVTATRKGVHY